MSLIFYREVACFQAAGYLATPEIVGNALEPMIMERARDYRRGNPGLGCAKL